MKLRYQEYVFDFIFYISIILYFTAYIGIIFSYIDNATIIENIDIFMKYYISLFLLVRFNPLLTNDFTNYDKKIAFTSGIVLFTSTTIGSYINNLKQYILHK